MYGHDVCMAMHVWLCMAIMYCFLQYNIVLCEIFGRSRMVVIFLQFKLHGFSDMSSRTQRVVKRDKGESEKSKGHSVRSYFSATNASCISVNHQRFEDVAELTYLVAIFTNS